MRHPEGQAHWGTRLAGILAQLAELDREAIRQPPGVDGVSAAVSGIGEITGGLAELVTTLTQQAPAVLDADAQTVQELLADLHAVHNGLLPGPMVLAPAADDLAARADLDKHESLAAGQEPAAGLQRRHRRN
jgi:NAD(P)H-hydrate repair Nnr-like enzyme with NAD(P)H-hydrate dehydratase domain